MPLSQYRRHQDSPYTTARFGTGEFSGFPFNPDLPKDKKPALLAIGFGASEPMKWQLRRNGFAQYSLA